MTTEHDQLAFWQAIRTDAIATHHTDVSVEHLCASRDTHDNRDRYLVSVRESQVWAHTKPSSREPQPSSREFSKKKTHTHTCKRVQSSRIREFENSRERERERVQNDPFTKLEPSSQTT
jgi:hypothetical protein